jgi:hypothetical protein
MKKVSLLILLVIVLSTVLMAAVPVKTVRLTLINKSDFDVYMKLEGSDVTEAFYYLTVPAGTRDEPTVKVFTVMTDLYSRETWVCDGYKSSGQLLVASNTRLVFTPCYEFLNLNVQGKSVAGEPTMEKVIAFRYFYGPFLPNWENAYLYTGYFNWGCYTWYWRARTYRRPDGCWFRYQY